MLRSIERLRILPLVVTARARAAVELQEFAGSTLRGAFGRALKDAVCVTSHRECGACRVAGDCAYPAIFEDRAAHPYRLDAPDGGVTLAQGAEFSFRITLIGRAVEWMPAIVDAVLRMGDSGLGRTRGAFDVERVVRVAPAAPDAVIASGVPLTLAPGAHRAVLDPSAFLPEVEAARGRRFAFEFTSPLRLIEDGEVCEAPDFATLARALLRRAAALLRAHEGVSFDLPAAERADLRARAAAVATVASDLARVDQVRFSARQHRTMNLFGMRGRVVFEVAEGDVVPLLPLLALGVAIGVGKGTTFGLGRMRVIGAVE